MAAPTTLPWKHALAPLALGLLLRLFFIHRYPHIEGDVLVYGDLAGNWLTHHVYGLTGDAGVHGTLIRLPGYPLFLAACFALFGVGHYTPVLLLQAVADLAGACVLGQLSREAVSPRAGYLTLWLAALCPFTANYCAAPLTETLSVFCVSAALFSGWKLLRALLDGTRSWRWAVLLGLACAYAVLLRPDGVLLPVALALGLSLELWRKRVPATKTGAPHVRSICGEFTVAASARAAMIVLLVTLLPLVPWTIRNWRVFHVFQPLAPRSASDPGEYVATGYDAWAKTWFLDAVSNEEVFWNADGDTLDIGRLPSRAFDSPDQYDETQQLLDDYNETTSLSPDFDARFAQLARERDVAYPMRSKLWLPLGRVADMWLRPRTEMLPTYMRWWGWHRRGLAWLPIAFGLLNLLLLGCAAAAFCMRRVRSRLPLAGGIVLFVLMRSAVLFTLPNAEPRYTLECFPAVFVCAGAFLASRNVRAIYAGRRSSASS